MNDRHYVLWPCFLFNMSTFVSRLYSKISSVTYCFLTSIYYTVALPCFGLASASRQIQVVFGLNVLADLTRSSQTFERPWAGGWAYISRQCFVATRTIQQHANHAAQQRNTHCQRQPEPFINTWTRWTPKTTLLSWPHNKHRPARIIISKMH